MAATYEPDFTYPKDRVRLAVSDRAAPFDFDDDEILYALTDADYRGDPAEAGPKQTRPELLAAIALLESSDSSAGEASTIKQGSVTFQVGGESRDRTTILADLRRRLRSSSGNAPAVADGYPFSCA